MAAVAVLGAFAGSALAADVQLYGIVDMGLVYSHVDTDGIGDDVDSFQMKSGQASGSRWGFKGTEDLGNGLTVGFILEDGFDADDGSEDSTGVMFNRESSLFLQGSFGKFAMGRMGALNNGQSSWAKVGMLSAFGTSDWGGYSAQLSNIFSLAGQWDNMIAYETPDFAGFKVYAQYGMGSADENESTSDRFYAIGATYNNGPIAGYFAVDSINYKTWGDDAPVAGADEIEDSLTVTLGGSYDFDVVKVYLGAQYFDEVKLSSIGGIVKDYKDAPISGSAASFTKLGDLKIKGYGISLTGDAPVAGGKVMFGVGYVDADAADSMTDARAELDDVSVKRYVVSVGYDYPFSKRTDVYAVASYSQDQLEWRETGGKNVGAHDNDLSSYAVVVGLRHRF